jgi:hypothetical protein
LCETLSNGISFRSLRWRFSLGSSAQVRSWQCGSRTYVSLSLLAYPRRLGLRLSYRMLSVQPFAFHFTPWLGLCPRRRRPWRNGAAPRVRLGSSFGHYTGCDSPPRSTTSHRPSHKSRTRVIWCLDVTLTRPAVLRRQTPAPTGGARSQVTQPEWKNWVCFAKHLSLDLELGDLHERPNCPTSSRGCAALIAIQHT